VKMETMHASGDTNVSYYDEVKATVYKTEAKLCGRERGRMSRSLSVVSISVH
jgi:hypothetical protein